MKKLLFAAYSLDIGGIEKALITLANYLQKKGYEITIVLEKKQGIFLKELDKNIKILEYRPDESKNILKRKIKNLRKRLKFIAKYKNKFDFSCSYATYSKSASFIARTSSNNSILWVHSEYMKLFKDNRREYIKFFNEISIRKFKKVVFVSKKAKDIFVNTFKRSHLKIKKLQDRTEVIYNLIDYNKIVEQSKEQVKDIRKEKIYTFLNVGRHSEDDKRLSRIIEVSRKLKERKFEFRVLFIGEGKETENYKEMVKENNLQKEIVFLGKKENPYPYYKIADSFLLTSEYEGFPVVYIESMILELPIITTNVSDSKQIIENKYGIVVEKNLNSIYNAMERAIKSGVKCKEKFNCEIYNKEIEDKIIKLINK